MKALRALLLILSIVVGHAQACHAIWRLPSGKVCEACPKERCVTQKESAEPTVVAAIDDCRACCVQSHCDHDSGDLTKVFPVAPQLVLARIEPVLVLPSAPLLTRDPISVVVSLYLPNAPPSRHSARAPPSPLS